VPDHPGETPPEPPRPPGNWGLPAAQCLCGRREPAIKVSRLDSKGYSGILVGLDPYNLFICQPNERVLMIPKHAIKHCHAAPPETKA
jgi:hypothetical protein